MERGNSFHEWAYVTCPDCRRLGLPGAVLVSREDAEKALYKERDAAIEKYVEGDYAAGAKSHAEARRLLGLPVEGQ